METVTIPKKEYELLKEAHALLHDADFIQKLNRLAELLLAEKWGIVLSEVKLRETLLLLQLLFDHPALHSPTEVSPSEKT